MNVNFKYFNRKQLPFNKEMNLFWKDNGFLVIEGFYDFLECDKLRNQAHKLIKDFDPLSIQSVFDTSDQKHAEDKYFLDSADKIHFFFEKKAFDKKGNLNNPTELVINKIGHALHDLDPELSLFKRL